MKPNIHVYQYMNEWISQSINQRLFQPRAHSTHAHTHTLGKKQETFYRCNLLRFICIAGTLQLSPICTITDLFISLYTQCAWWLRWYRLRDGCGVLIGTPYSVDRSEEVVMEGYRTATLDLKRRNKSSVPYADTEDDVCISDALVAGLYLMGGQGVWPPQEVADPQKVLQNLFGGSTLTPLRTPRFHFLAKPVYLCTTKQLYAAYASLETDVI